MNLEEIYKETHYNYLPTVRGHLYNNISNREDADDILQDVFFKFWERLATFRFEVAPSILLDLTMQQYMINYFRRKYIYSVNFVSLEIAKGTSRIRPGSFPENHLEILLRIATGEKKSLLLAIKKTKERSEL